MSMCLCFHKCSKYKIYASETRPEDCEEDEKYIKVRDELSNFLKTAGISFEDYSRQLKDIDKGRFVFTVFNIYFTFCSFHIFHVSL